MFFDILLISNGHYSAVWKAMGGSLPEDDTSMHKEVRIYEDPYGSEDSSTKRTDPLGLRLELWPRWVSFLRYTAPEQYANVHLDQYWYPYVAPQDQPLDTQHSRGYGTLLRCTFRTVT